MTSVVGILNKRGAAIAADSAVTRIIGQMGKVTKNGNKMIRLSDVVPVTVMVTGNAEYLSDPWDVIIRRYRQQKGKISQPTVEALARDFFDYIASNKVFWDEKVCARFLKDLVYNVFSASASKCNQENERKDDGSMRSPGAFRKAMIRELSAISREHRKEEQCPQFAGYSLEDFKKAASGVIDNFFAKHCIENSNKSSNERYPSAVLDAIRPQLEQTLLDVLSHHWNRDRNSDRYRDWDPSATLVFTGFGSEQEYPSLVSAVVCEGFDHRMNYTISPKDIVCISDKKPVAICPFAQDDVIKSILCGIHYYWRNSFQRGLEGLTKSLISDVFESMKGEKSPSEECTTILTDVLFEGHEVQYKFKKAFSRMYDRNQHEWEKALEKYDLEEMAALADSLINLTGFHRILTFSDEGVGGLVDLAVISKNEGFTWLRRKSWYHKDNGGGSVGFGI